MRMAAKWIARSALLVLVGSAVISCGDDSDADGSPSGGTAGTGGTAGSGGTLPQGGKAPSEGGSDTGGKSAMGGAGGAADGGSAGESEPIVGGAAGDGGAEEPGSGGAPPEAGAGGAAGDGGMGGAAGESDPGGAAGAAGAPEVIEGMHIYVGCSNSSGTIQRYVFDRNVGDFTLLGSVAAGSGLSAAVLHPDGERLYVSHGSQGRITIFERDPFTGGLEELDSVTVPFDPENPSGSTKNPQIAALAVDSGGTHLAVASAASDLVLAFALDEDGLVGDVAGFDGAGLTPRDVLFNTTDGFVVVPYADSDKVVAHEFDEGDLKTEVETSLPADSGPNGVAMHPNGDWLYVLNGSEGSVSFFAFDENSGAMNHVETIDVPVPDDFVGPERNASAIAITPNGKFLYVTSRLDGVEDGTLATFAITASGPDAGKLDLLDPGGVIGTEGVGPSDFAISEDGTFLVVANEESDTIAGFNLNAATGAPVLVKTRTACNGPQFVLIVTN
ncbi:MAG: beta-propeller fold lactonase family protein [Pseudomonadota bacterium]|nr:MAG: hypothetical protein DIU78_10665 [Pseudomonadota bacterium]